MSNTRLDEFENEELIHHRYGRGTIMESYKDTVVVQFENGEKMHFLKDALNDPNYFYIKTSNECERIMIEKIKLENLFGSINSDIEIDTSNNVSILTAPNGCGKTTTFKLLNFIFSPTEENFNSICKIPFDRFSCVLSNGKTVSLEKRHYDITKEDFFDKRSEAREEMQYHKQYFNDDVNLCYSIYKYNEELMAPLAEVSFFNKKNLDNSFYPLKKASVHSERQNELASEGRIELFIEGIKRINTIENCTVKIDFIEADRLQKIYYSVARRNRISHRTSPRFSMPEKVDYLQFANEDITRKIRLCVNSYNRKIADAKDKLVYSYINKQDVKEESFSTFEKKWNKYFEELKKYFDIGILDSPEIILFVGSDLKKAYEKKASFLITYLDIFEESLEPLERYYDKFKLFIDIFNKRNEITNKTIKFTTEGIKVSSGGKDIDIENLSSGEKNDFIMFYKLIFEAEPNDIVLIDEPEISLHIEWQEEYLDRLIEICQMNDLQAIVATHSPNIVNGHIDLFVEKR